MASLAAGLAAGLAAPASSSAAAAATGVSQRRPAPKPADRRRAEVLGRLTMLSITIDVEEAPARDVLKLIARRAGFNVVARWQRDHVSGMDPNTPITVKLADVDPLTVIDSVLGQCGDWMDERCTWQLADGWIDVGPISWLSRSSARTTRLHDVGSVIIDVPNFGMSGGGDRVSDSNGRSPGRRRTPAEGAADLIELVVAAVEPDAWRRNGGTAATVRWHRSALVVSAPDFIHRQLGGYPFRPIPPVIVDEPDIVGPGDSEPEPERVRVRVNGVRPLREFDPAAIRRSGRPPQPAAADREDDGKPDGKPDGKDEDPGGGG